MWWWWRKQPRARSAADDAVDEAVEDLKNAKARWPQVHRAVNRARKVQERDIFAELIQEAWAGRRHGR